jgi:hypothetical protein
MGFITNEAKIISATDIVTSWMGRFYKKSTITF